MRRWLPASLVLAAYAFSAAVYSRLPARVVTHWGTRGPNGWSPRWVAALLLPTITLGVWLLMRWLPAIDPKRENYDKFRGTYDAVVATIVGVLVAAHVAMLGIALGWPIRMELVAPVAVGLMFIVVGWLLPRSHRTWFFGIRTPWTLSSDEVWTRTHRVGGPLFVVCGLFVIIGAFVGPSWWPLMLIAAVTVLVVGLYAYSYFVWRRLGGSET